LLAIAANTTSNAAAPLSNGGKREKDLRKIGLLAAIPMKPSGTGRLSAPEGARWRFASGTEAHSSLPETNRSRRDERFAVSATEARELTQERANDGNRGKAIRGGIATLRLGELNSAGGSVFRAIQQQHRNLPIRLTSTEGAGRCRNGGLSVGRGAHDMRSRAVDFHCDRTRGQWSGRLPANPFLRSAYA
jgi:hypothetical protein